MTIKRIILPLLLLLCHITAEAQQFSVVGMRLLPNDVSAFITPVRDLNNEACALLKINAPKDFAFTSPLGIVKRKDEVGEIWLYLPNGSRQITIKHPQWGVMRDYMFKKPLESHMTYEMVIRTPTPVTVTGHDTVVLVRTVTDTITVKRHRAPVPLSHHAMLTASFCNGGPAWGVMYAMMRRHGFFIHIAGTMTTVGDTQAECDKEGFLTGEDIKPYYTGGKRRSTYTITTGAVHRICKTIRLYEGIGYGKSQTAWELAGSEGGGYALNKGLEHKGIAAEAGIMAVVGRVCISASAITIAGSQWQCCAGIGINF